MGAALDALDQFLTNGINKFILWALALSSLFLVLDAVGLLPRRLSELTNRNRLRETMRILKEFGIDVETTRRANQVARLEQISGRDLADRVTQRLVDTKIDHPVTIGTQVAVPGKHYFDLMGCTSDIRIAQLYARDLSAHWRSLAGVGGAVANTDIDFIVAPKTGSPLLAAYFAELIRKPLLLHNPDVKFRSDPDDPRASFDCLELPKLGSRALMVDDSSTGGGKAARLIDDLRRCGWQISDFLIVFEPLLKAPTGQNAKERLRPKGVAVHSIVQN